MTIKTITVGVVTDDDNGISVSQAKVAAGNLTITGALATGGVATMPTAQEVVLTVAADETGLILTVTGTDADGVAITDTIAGPASSTASTVKHFKTVTQIAANQATAGNVIVGVLKANGATSATTTVNVNQYGDDFKYLGVFDITGAGTYTLQGSIDEPTVAQDASTWYAFTSFSAVTADVAALLVFPAKKVRLLCTANTSGTAQAQIQIRGQDFIQRTK